MGQPIVVTEKATADPRIVRFETNRVLTGTGHERYTSGGVVAGDRPPDELARRLFARGGIESVHVYSNMVTVQLDAGGKADGLREIVENLHIHYREGVTPSYP